MTGWIVENTSRSGWRRKWRFRIVTTVLSVTLVSAPRSDGACGRGSRRGRSRTFSSGTAAALCGLPFRSVLAGQLEEDVIQRRSAQAHVAAADPGAT